MNKFMSIGAFSLAITAFVYQFTDDKIIWISVLVVSFLIAYLLSFLEKILTESQGAFLNWFLYHISKNRDPYIIEYSEAKYEYKSLNEMEYSKEIELISCKNHLKKYSEKFCWSSYSKDITILPIYEGQTINYLPSKNFWTLFEIDLGRRLRKRQTETTGMKIIGLKDDLGLAKPFLSIFNERKTKESKLVVIIPEELHPQNARFEICQGNNSDNVIKRSLLEYNESIGGYEMSVKYPRKGWTYSIIWDW